MKDQVKVFRIIALLVCVVGSAIVFNSLYKSICAIRYVTYSFDHSIAPEMQQNIVTHVALFQHDGLYNPKSIIDTIQKHFACVKSISVHCIPHNAAEVTVTAHEPIVRINEKYVVTAAKTIVPDFSYASYILTSLSSLSIVSPVPQDCSENMMCAIRKCIKDRIFERYTLCWVGEHEIYLHDSHDPSFSLLCDVLSLPSPTKLVLYEQLKNNIKNKRSASKRWVADIRFDDQIIVSGDKGGRYGKGV